MPKLISMTTARKTLEPINLGQPRLFCLQVSVQEGARFFGIKTIWKFGTNNMNKSLEIGIKLQADRNTTSKRQKKSSLRLYTPLIALLTSTREIMMFLNMIKIQMDICQTLFKKQIR